MIRHWGLKAKDEDVIAESLGYRAPSPPMRLVLIAAASFVLTGGLIFITFFTGGS